MYDQINQVLGAIIAGDDRALIKKLSETDQPPTMSFPEEVHYFFLEQFTHLVFSTVDQAKVLRFFKILHMMAEKDAVGDWLEKAKKLVTKWGKRSLINYLNGVSHVKTSFADDFSLPVNLNDLVLDLNTRFGESNSLRQVIVGVREKKPFAIGCAPSSGPVMYGYPEYLITHRDAVNLRTFLCNAQNAACSYGDKSYSYGVVVNFDFNRFFEQLIRSRAIRSQSSKDLECLKVLYEESQRFYPLEIDLEGWIQKSVGWSEAQNYLRQRQEERKNRFSGVLSDPRVRGLLDSDLFTRGNFKEEITNVLNGYLSSQEASVLTRLFRYSKKRSVEELLQKISSPKDCCDFLKALFDLAYENKESSKETKLLNLILEELKKILIAEDRRELRSDVAKYALSIKDPLPLQWVLLYCLKDDRDAFNLLHQGLDSDLDEASDAPLERISNKRFQWISFQLRRLFCKGLEYLREHPLLKEQGLELGVYFRFDCVEGIQSWLMERRRTLSQGCPNEVDEILKICDQIVRLSEQLDSLPESAKLNTLARKPTFISDNLANNSFFDIVSKDYCGFQKTSSTDSQVTQAIADGRGKSVAAGSGDAGGVKSGKSSRRWGRGPGG